MEAVPSDILSLIFYILNPLKKMKSIKLLIGDMAGQQII